MADEKTDGKDEKAGGRKKLAFLENKVIMLGAIVVLQAVVAIGLTQFVILPRLGVQAAGTTEEPVAEEAPALPELGVLVNLEEMIVTLDSDARKPRYLRINVNLEVRDAVVAKIAGERVPQLRDIVIMALSTKTVEDLSTPAGKKTLRDEIFRDVSARMPEGALMNVYFSDLVVQ